MKTINYYWSIFAFVALLFTSCSTEETAVDTSPDAKNSAELTFGATLDNLANRAMNKGHFGQVPTCSDAEPDSAMVTFSYPGSGVDIVVEVGISKDSNGYFTEYSELLKIPVAQGSDFTKVTLKGFKVYDSNNNLIWVAPVAPGDFSGYINKPLPFDIDVYKGTKPYINVEVLCFDRRDVNEYGYPFFDLMPGKIYPLCFFANLCVGQRHFVGDYSVDLYYNDGTGRIQLYTSGDANAMPNTGFANGEYFAKPLCLVVPDKPEGFQDSQDYLFYVITPKDWTGSYGDVDNTPLAEVGLSWDDVNGLLNNDGTSNEYIHVFIGCGDNPGGGDDCDDNGGDADGDGICDNDDDCVNGQGDGCEPGGGDDCLLDSDSDGVANCNDVCPDEAGTVANNGCPETNGGDDNCETAFMYGNDADLEFRDFHTGNGKARWGWIAQGEGTYTIYAGAGNNYNKDMPVGTAVVTSDADNVYVTIDWAAGYEFTELHIDIFASMPSYDDVKAPGQYSYNESNNSGEKTYTYTNPTGNDNFFIVVHAKSCSLAQ